MNTFATTCCGVVCKDSRETNLWSGACPNPECSSNFTGYAKL